MRPMGCAGRAVFSDREELARLLGAFNEVKPGAFFPHLRSESDNILRALTEVLEVATDASGGGKGGVGPFQASGPLTVYVSPRSWRKKTKNPKFTSCRT